MKKKALVLTSVASMISQFLMPSVRLLQSLGYEVNIACNFKVGSNCSEDEIKDLKRELKRLNVKYYQIDFIRNAANINNLRAYKQCRALIKANNYCLVHCHSPIGGLLARIICRHRSTKVFYTAHGFHFYKGAPLKNWLLYYPAELVCSYFTDVLITINKEDYEFAKNRLHASKTYYVPGVGVNLDKFKAISTHSQAKREELKIPSGAVWVLAVGELSKRKNHEPLIRAVADFNNCYLTIAGIGGLNTHLTKVINELGLQGRVKLLGFRSDIPELYDAADICALPSLQEGLSVALMEAMAAGKPVICSKIRGNTDLIDQNGGELFNPHSTESIKQAIAAILKRNLRELGLYNLNKIKHFDLETVINSLRSIYGTVLARGGHLLNVLRLQRLKASLNIPLSAFTIVSVGELNVNKNHEVILKALARLKNSDIHFCIAGKGVLCKRIVAVCESLGTASNVHFLGYRADVADLYRLADACSLTSIREGLGLAALEGMAAGLPLLASHNRGTAEYCTNQNSFSCEFNNEVGFAHAIYKLYKSPSLRAQMGAQALIASSRFSVPVVCEQLKKIYLAEGE